MKPIFNQELSLTDRLTAFTDDDSEFRRELIGLMISNLRELYQAAQQAHAHIFEQAAHKAKSTLTIIDNREINQFVVDFKALLKAPQKSVIRKKIEQFFQLIDHQIKCLENEAVIKKAS